MQWSTYSDQLNSQEREGMSIVSITIIKWDKLPKFNRRLGLSNLSNLATINPLVTIENIEKKNQFRPVFETMTYFKCIDSNFDLHQNRFFYIINEPKWSELCSIHFTIYMYGFDLSDRFMKLDIHGCCFDVILPVYDCQCRYLPPS